MTSFLQDMLSRYEIKNVKDEENAIKEILQECILCELSKAGFFEHAIFCGGTALRIFYHLDRFSEDLDFSLEVPQKDFSIEKYLQKIKGSMQQYGINLEVDLKKQRTAVQSAFLKVNTIQQFLLFEASFDSNIYKKDEKIKIKIEIDTNPPEGGTFEFKRGILPSIYSVRIFDRSSLFAGKIHSILCRFWDNRVKGRDLYDFIFYVRGRTPINLTFVENAMKQSGHLGSNDSLTMEKLKALLKDKFNTLDYELAKKDVRPFINDQKEIELWDKDLFVELVDML